MTYPTDYCECCGSLDCGPKCPRMCRTEPEHLHTLADDEHRALERLERMDGFVDEEIVRLRDKLLAYEATSLGLMRITPSGQAIRDRVREMADDMTSVQVGWARTDVCSGWTTTRGVHVKKATPLGRAVLRQRAAETTVCPDHGGPCNQSCRTICAKTGEDLP
jgi:hypothetical protein